MAEITFRSHMLVDLVKSLAKDEDVLFSARVSTLGERSRDEIDKDPQRSAGLINYLMREKHGSPFEHNSFTFFIQAPIFVFREFMRHRVGWSYSESSGRYRELEPVFYVPPANRPLVQVGKAGHYQFEAGTEDQHLHVEEGLSMVYTYAYREYTGMLSNGIAREVARAVLPVGIYSSMYATCNARSLMNFLSLRVHDPEATFPSYPQWEIQQVAEQMEQYFAEKMPLTYNAYIDNGRVAP